MGTFKSVASWAALILVAFALILVSPLALVALAGAADADWVLVSNVGQAYEFASAALSGLALLAVTYTVFVQQRDSKAARVEAHRPAHLQLMKMAIDEPILMAALGAPREDHDSSRQHLYINLLFSWWRHSFTTTGTQNEGELLENAGAVFRSAAGRAYWEQVRANHSGYYQTAKDREFANIVDRVYKEAVSRPVQQSGDSARSGTELNWRRTTIASGLLGVFLGFVAGSRMLRGSKSSRSR